MADKTKKIADFPVLNTPNGNTRVLVSHASNSGITNTYNLTIQKLTDTIVDIYVPEANTSVSGTVKVGNNLYTNVSGHLMANLTGYQTTAGLADNVARLSANSASYLGSYSANDFVTNTYFTSYLETANLEALANLSSYQTTAGLAANVATLASNTALTANNSSYLGGIAANGYLTVSAANLSAYQTIAGLETSIANLSVNTALNANNSEYLGGVAANSYLTISAANLSAYQTTAGLAANVATLESNNALTANNSNYLGGVAANSYLTVDAANLTNYATTSSLSSYQTTAGLAANVAVLSANNASYLGGVAANSYLTISAANLSAYQTTAGLAANVSGLLSNGNISLSQVYANGGIGTNKQVLTSNASGGVYWSNYAGANSFLSLTDTPSSFSGYGGYFLFVDASETQIGFSNEININELIHTAKVAPSSVANDSVSVYVTASGSSPSREVAYKIKNELGEEVILSSILV